MDSINNACKFGSDAWLELQAFKTRQLNRREKLNRHKNLNHQDHLINQQPQLVSNNSLAASTSSSSSTSTTQAGPSSSTTNSQNSSTTIACNITNESQEGEDTLNNSTTANNNTNVPDEQPTTSPSSDNATSAAAATTTDLEQQIDSKLIECVLLLKLCDVALKLPIDSRSLSRSISKIKGLEGTSKSMIENFLQKFAHQELIVIEEQPGAAMLLNSRRRLNSMTADDDDESCIYVISADHTKLVEFDKSFGSSENIRALLLESSKTLADDIDETDFSIETNNSSVPKQAIRQATINHSDHHNTFLPRDKQFLESFKGGDSKKRSEALCGDNLESSSSGTILDNNKNNNSKSFDQSKPGDDLESLLSLSSTRERENKKLGEELLELLSKPTAKERNLLERFRSADGYRVQEFCPKGTKGECKRNNENGLVCEKLHFKKIIAKHTEESLGDCSFLNTCFHMDSCKYVHYEVDYGNDNKQPHQFKKPHPQIEQSNSPNKQQQQQQNFDKSTNNNNNINPHTTNAKTNDNNDHLMKSKPNSTTSNNKDSNNNRSQSAISIKSSSSSSSSSSSLSVSGDASCSGSSSSSLAAASRFVLSPEEQARIDAKNRKRFKTVLYPPQWIQCDLRFFDMSLLGKFSVVMADPPWDIHMELPYGTMSDDEMRKLNIPALQDEGVIFLWVTGRAMELGRECLALWGYERCDEIIWVKTNQLQRIIRTGRTGHWLNHGKEHCLVGVKGNPKDINRGLDCDVIVAEVRATSHKPDEIYGIIERLSPGTRKIELFGRAHNVQPNWITLGNQLDGVRLVEPNLVNSFKKLNMPFQTTPENVT